MATKDVDKFVKRNAPSKLNHRIHILKTAGVGAIVFGLLSAATHSIYERFDQDKEPIPPAVEPDLQENFTLTINEPINIGWVLSFKDRIAPSMYGANIGLQPSDSPISIHSILRTLQNNSYFSDNFIFADMGIQVRPDRNIAFYDSHFDKQIEEIPARTAFESGLYSTIFGAKNVYINNNFLPNDKYYSVKFNSSLIPEDDRYYSTKFNSSLIPEDDQYNYPCFFKDIWNNSKDIEIRFYIDNESNPYNIGGMYEPQFIVAHFSNGTTKTHQINYHHARNLVDIADNGIHDSRLTFDLEWMLAQRTFFNQGYWEGYNTSLHNTMTDLAPILGYDANATKDIMSIEEFAEFVGNNSQKEILSFNNTIFRQIYNNLSNESQSNLSMLEDLFDNATNYFVDRNNNTIYTLFHEDNKNYHAVVHTSEDTIAEIKELSKN